VTRVRPLASQLIPDNLNDRIPPLSHRPEQTGAADMAGQNNVTRPLDHHHSPAAGHEQEQCADELARALCHDRVRAGGCRNDSISTSSSAQTCCPGSEFATFLAVAVSVSGQAGGAIAGGCACSVGALRWSTSCRGKGEASLLYELVPVDWRSCL